MLELVITPVADLLACLQVTYSASQLGDPHLLVDRLESAGFAARLRSVEPAPPPTQLARLRVAGMTCGSCSGAVESALAVLPGVQHAAVSLTLQEAKVEYDPALLDEVSHCLPGRARGCSCCFPRSLLHCPTASCAPLVQMRTAVVVGPSRLSCALSPAAAGGPSARSGGGGV